MLLEDLKMRWDMAEGHAMACQQRIQITQQRIIMIDDDLTAGLQISAQRILRIAVMRCAAVKVEVILFDVGIDEMIEAKQGDALLGDGMRADFHDHTARPLFPRLLKQPG